MTMAMAGFLDYKYSCNFSILYYFAISRRITFNSCSKNNFSSILIYTAFIIYKILKIYSEDKYIPYFGAIFYLSFPYFAFSAMSFRTIAQINFFSALSFYYAIKPGGFTLSYLKKISIAFAAAIGTKLSAALLSPLLLLIIFDRAGYKFTKKN